MIECSNAMFCWHLTRIGGVETFIYTLARMFSARDFVIVYRVRATDIYTKHHIYDAKLHRVIPEGEEWIVNHERLQQLLGDNPTGYRLAELVEEVEAR
jgi:hypothetical protein